MSSIVVSELHVYPVKSLAGISLQSSRIDALGLVSDRRWMVVDESGHMMTQRVHPRMALIRPTLDDDRLRLDYPGKAPIEVPAAEGGERVPVRVWDDTVNALTTDPDVDWWLSEVLGEPARLVRFPRDEKRPVDRNYARAGDQTAFSDGFPILLIGQGSLDDLNGRLDTPLPMRRFRPNIVVSGAAPYAEDDWQGMEIAGVHFRIVKPCSRCVVTTVDPDTGEVAGEEPLRTLATYRLRDGKVMFGQNVIPDNAGILRLGDVVHID